MSEPTRAYLYRVLLGAQPLVTAYGIVDDQKAALWVGLGAAVLGIGLAAKNTSTK